MKVIKKFNPEKWTKEYICICLSVLEVSYKDFKYHFDTREGDYVSFLCPVCSRVNTIDIKFIPPSVRGLIHNNSKR